MQFSGASLRGILADQRDTLDVRDQNGGPVMLGVPVARALKDIDIEKYLGVGNRKRIRHLRPVAVSSGPGWLGGSHTTVPMRADQTCKLYGAGQLMGNRKTLREFIPQR